MKAKIFNQASQKGIRRTASAIRVTRKGAFSLSKGAALSLGVSIGDKISLVQDEESPKDWYLVRDQENGFELRSYNGQQSAVMFNASVAANAMIDAVGHSLTSVSFLIGKDPVVISKKDHWPIITSSAKE